MKTFKSLLLVTVLSVFGISAGFAQGATNSVEATVSAVIVQDLTIEKVADMNFGVIIPGSTASEILLSPAGGVTVPLGNLNQLLAPQTGASPEAAEFRVTGSGVSVYTVTLPTSETITNTNGDTMTVDTFLPSLGVNITNGVTDAVDLEGTLGIEAIENFTVGAKLSVAGGQAPGVYTGTFDVTVNYL